MTAIDALDSSQFSNKFLSIYMTAIAKEEKGTSIAVSNGSNKTNN